MQITLWYGLDSTESFEYFFNRVAWGGKFKGRSSPIEAECPALMWAMQCYVAGLLGIRVIYEGDNLPLINQKGYAFTYAQRFYTSVEEPFCSGSIWAPKRSGNKSADLLAKEWYYTLHINGVFFFLVLVLVSYIML